METQFVAYHNNENTASDKIHKVINMADTSICKPADLFRLWKVGVKQHVRHLSTHQRVEHIISILG